MSMPVKKTVTAFLSIAFDDWPKEITPSPELRKQFGHHQENWRAFERAYKSELRSPEAQGKLREIAKKAHRRRVTLVYGAKDKVYNHAVILKSVIEKMH